MTKIVKALRFEELSETAQEVAYKKWVADEERWGYAWDSEVRNVLDTIQENIDGNIQWEYSSYDHYVSVSLNNDVMGKSAINKACAIYFALTLFTPNYSRSHAAEGKFYAFAQKSGYTGLRLPNRYAMPCKNTCFTGYYLSEDFSHFLWDSIKNTSVETANLETILTNALDKTLDVVSSDYDWQFSRERFNDVIQDEDLYFLSNGMLIDDSLLEEETA